MLTAKDKITKARARLLAFQPFYGQLIMHLNVREEPKLGTMATDGATIYYDPEMVDKWSNEEIQGVLCHEVMHCALDHLSRLKLRNRLIWNLATDAIINEMITQTGLKLPRGCFTHPEAKKSDCFAERLYQMLLKECEQNGGSAGPAGYIEDMRDPAPGASTEESKREWEERMVAAASTLDEKTRGKLPAEIKRIIEELTQPQKNWREILKRYVTDCSRADYVMIPPNRRFISQGLYLPSMSSPALGDVCVCIDTSGSIGNAELATFLGELQGVLQAYECTLHLFYADAKVAGYECYQRYGASNLLSTTQPKGGGGTAFEPFFEDITKRGIRPSVAIYLTDGFGSFPAKAPRYPIIWVVSPNGLEESKFPFGIVAPLKEDNKR